jgi:hypothetical protein
MAETETGKVVDVHQPSRLFVTMNVIEHCSTVILDKGLMLWSYLRRTGRLVRRTVIRPASLPYQCIGACSCYLLPA